MVVGRRLGSICRHLCRSSWRYPGRQLGTGGARPRVTVAWLIWLAFRLAYGGLPVAMCMTVQAHAHMSTLGVRATGLASSSTACCSGALRMHEWRNASLVSLTRSVTRHAANFAQTLKAWTLPRNCTFGNNCTDMYRHVNTYQCARHCMVCHSRQATSGHLRPCRMPCLTPLPLALQSLKSTTQGSRT